jgi:hypothetical protein
LFVLVLFADVPFTGFWKLPKPRRVVRTGLQGIILLARTSGRPICRNDRRSLESGVDGPGERSPISMRISAEGEPATVQVVDLKPTSNVADDFFTRLSALTERPSGHPCSIFIPPDNFKVPSADNPLPLQGENHQVAFGSKKSKPLNRRLNDGFKEQCRSACGSARACRQVYVRSCCSSLAIRSRASCPDRCVGDTGRLSGL